MTTFTTQDREEALKAIEGDDEIQAAATQEPRSFWNHRVIRSINEFGEEWFEVCEVYYNDKGKPCGYCNGYVGGETLEELGQQFERLKSAMALPTLDALTDFNNQWGDEYEKEY